MSAPQGSPIAPSPPRVRLLFPETWPRGLLAGVLLAVAGFAAYSNTVSAPFIFDDLPGIVRNSTIRQLWPLTNVLFPEQDTGTGVVGRPIVNLSLAFNYAIGGLEVRGYHLFNLLLHVLAGGLLFAVLRRTWLQAPLRGQFGPAAGSLGMCGALLWVLHPLQTESVSCVIQRTEVMVALFYLLTTYAFVRAADLGNARRWQAVAVLACGLGMLTKEVMVTAPVLLLLYDRTFIAGTFAAAWRARRGLYGALVTTWLPLLWLVRRGEGRGGTVGFDLGVTPWEYLLTQSRALVLYLKLTFWPSTLVLDYGTAVVRSVREVGIEIAILAVLALGTLMALWRRPMVGFVAAMFFLILSPSSSFVPLATQTIAEHRVYLALAPVIAALLAGLHLCAGRRATFLALAASMVFGVLTWRRNLAYTSAVTIWSDTVAKAPGNARAHYNLANALSAADRLAGAVQHYETTLRLEPRYAAAHYNFGGALLRVGRVPEAIAQYEAALRFDPQSADVHANLAAALIRAGRAAEAVRHYEAAASAGMLAAEERRRFGRALAEVGRIEEGLTQLQEALRLAPREAETHVLLGLVLSAAGRSVDALRHFTEAVTLQPENAGARCALGDALVEARRPADALSHYEAALRLQPAQAAMIHTSMANAHALLGRLEQAVAHYETALRIDPNAAEARIHLQRLRALAERRGLLRK